VAPIGLDGEYQGFIHCINFGGVMPAGMAQEVMEAQQERARNKDRSNKPPKPPKRPNARIMGRAALESNY
jgi:hypothetical protein